MKLSYKTQFWTLIKKMRFLKRFSNLAKHNERLKFQILITIDKKSQAPKPQRGGHAHEGYG